MTIDRWVLPEEAIDWIHKSIPAGSTIVELGSGLGTVRLAFSYRVYSIECNADWLGKAKSVYIHAPLVDNWYSREPIAAGLPKRYSLLIVDGPLTALRDGLALNLDLFRPDVPALFDDINISSARRPFLAMAKARGVKAVMFPKTKSGKRWGVVPAAKGASHANK